MGEGGTLQELLDGSRELLVKAEREEAARLVQILAEHVFGQRELRLRRLDLAHPNLESVRVFREGLDRLLGGEPVQYVTGTTSFMGIELLLTPDVLVPRSETEQLVELVLAGYKQVNGGTLFGLDVGTGSGNIPIALCRFLTGVRMTTIDNSSAALAIAKRNVEINELTDYITLCCVDFLKEDVPLESPFNFLISNPPYISDSEFSHLGRTVKAFEPHQALTDRADGLTFYRRIATVSRRVLKPGGMIFVEVAYDQAPAVYGIFADAGLENLRWHPDYSGTQRFVTASTPII